MVVAPIFFETIRYIINAVAFINQIFKLWW